MPEDVRVTPGVMSRIDAPSRRGGLHRERVASVEEHLVCIRPDQPRRHPVRAAQDGADQGSAGSVPARCPRTPGCRWPGR